MKNKIENIFSLNLKKVLEEKRITQEELAYKFNSQGYKITQQTISNWCKGLSLPRMDKVQILCEILNISRDTLIGDDNNKLFSAFPNIQKVSTESIPVLGSVRCGKPVFMNEEHTDYVEKPDGIKCDFCLRATGDSVIEKDILDGDYVFIEQTSEIINGKIYVVAIDDEATLKIVDYDKLNNTISLIPANKNFQIMTFKDEQLDHIHILGRAIYFKRYL